jgi:hypothetical protein
MYSFTFKFKNTNTVFESHDRFEAAIRELTSNTAVDGFIRELAHGLAQGWTVNRSLKKLNVDGVDAAFVFYCKTVTNLKSLQDCLENSSYFKSIITGLKAAGWEVTSEVGQENDDFFVYNLETALVADTHLEQ